MMTRLTAFETNHTLYIRYVEEQSRGVRAARRGSWAPRRNREPFTSLTLCFWGNTDGGGQSTAQVQGYHRTVREWQRQMKTLESEWQELKKHVNYLANEVFDPLFPIHLSLTMHLGQMVLEKY